ncbi:MAG TPA: TonB-dependent receptor [Gemmatimonadales bacterium]|nr:TonB-dependent receptor [Gemmatimonadales bacterium]
MKPLLLACLLLSLTTPLAGQQPARVHGTVVDSSSGRPIAGAEVGLGEDDRVSTASGQFLFGSVASGSLRIRVRALGYRPLERELDVVPGGDLRIDLPMARLAVQIDSMLIRAQPDASLSGAELEQRGRTLAAALDGWEGVVVTRTGAGDEAVPQVRGSGADEVLVLVNGFPANNAFTGRADLGRLYSRDVERVSLDRGGQSARFGSRAIAGVISIETRRGGNSSFGGTVGSFGAIESAAALAGSTGRLSLSVAELPNRFEFASPGSGQGIRQNAGGSVYTLNARYGRKVDLTARATLANRGLPGTTVNPTPAARAEERTAFLGVRTGERFQVKAAIEWLSTRAWDSVPPPGFTAYDATTTGFGGSGGIALRHVVTIAGWSGQVTWSGEARYDAFNGDAVLQGAHFSRIGVGTAAAFERSTGSSAWRLAPSFRLEWWSGRKDPAASARLDALWSRHGTRATFALGSAVTAPALADVLFQEGVGVRLNPGLKPERVRWELEGGIGQRFHLGPVDAMANVRGFWGKVDDLILWNPVLRFIWTPGNFDVVRRGGEAALDVHLTASLSVSGSTNLSVITYDTPGAAQVRYRPRFTHTAEVRWNPDRWRFSARWHRLGTRFTTTVGTNPLPPVDLLNIGIERQLGRMLSVQSEVRDLLDQRPSYIAGFPAPGRSFHLSLNLEFP